MESAPCLRTKEQQKLHRHVGQLWEVLTGMRSEYFCRMRSASAFLFSKGCSSLNFDRMVDIGVGSVVECVVGVEKAGICIGCGCWLLVVGGLGWWKR
jgi:hypothetical protein